MSAGARWDQLTTKQRCFLLFKRLDLNSRAVAKLGSAVWYLTSDELDLERARQCAARDLKECAPDLSVALRTVMRERRSLREALERELDAMWREAAAAKAMAVGRK